MSCQNEEPHVLIIGAGITGLVLAQALRTHHIPFTIFERDPEPSTRGRGWGLTIHWALDTFLSLLPQSLVDRLPETYVDPVAVERGEKANFLFFDLRSGETRWQVPAAKRMRVSRERLRKLMMEGIEVKWSHSLASISFQSPNKVTAHFSHSSSVAGTLLIGADGSHSAVRSHLLSRNLSQAANVRLPIRFLGVNVVLPPSLALPARALDPFFFQGGDPQTDTFLWFSFLDTPTKAERDQGEDQWECQLSISYPYRAGVWSMEQPMEVPKTNKERVKLMKEFAKGWAEPFRSLIMGIPSDTEVKDLAIGDFLPKMGMWDNADGRVTMVGDAAHTMTMFRGEAANHGIMDVSVLLSHILPAIRDSKPPSPSPILGSPPTDMKSAISAYEKEMIARTGPAVLAARRAALDAHDYQSIDERSPLVSKRAIVLEE